MLAVATFSIPILGAFLVLIADRLSALLRNKRDLTALSRRFHQAQLKDYFQSPLGNRAREALVSAREGVTR